MRAHPSLTPSVWARLLSAAASLALVRHGCHHTTKIRGSEKTQPSEEPEKSSNIELKLTRHCCNAPPTAKARGEERLRLGL